MAEEGKGGAKPAREMTKRFLNFEHRKQEQRMSNTMAAQVPRVGSERRNGAGMELNNLYHEC